MLTFCYQSYIFLAGLQIRTDQEGVLRIALAAVVFAMVRLALACSSGVGFVVQLNDDPLRVWDVEELPNVEKASNESLPSLNSIVNISLSCKVYEDSSYEFFETRLSVPDDAVQWDVTVKGDGNTQSFDFGASANIFMKWSSEAVNLVDRSLTDVVVKDVTEMIITLR